MKFLRIGKLIEWSSIHCSSSVRLASSHLVFETTDSLDDAGVAIADCKS